MFQIEWCRDGMVLLGEVSPSADLDAATQIAISQMRQVSASFPDGRPDKFRILDKAGAFITEVRIVTRREGRT